MSDKIKISELPEATAVNDSDLVAIVQSGITKKATANKLPGAPLGYTPENITNKKTAWTGTPTDINYPSEKLTKDSLDLKSNIGHTHQEFAPDEHQHIANDVLYTGGVNAPGITNAKEAFDTLFGTNIPQWAGDRDWPENYFVYHLQILWVSNDVAPASHIPGTSNRWDRMLVLTAAEIRDLLKTLNVVNMLPAANVAYDPDGGKTVAAKINDLVTDINKKQDKLYGERFVVPDTGGFAVSTYTIEDKLMYPITIYVNRVPYFGKFCLPADVGIYDFSYRHVANDTIITSNQLASSPMSFNTNDVVDIIHSENPVGPETPGG